MNIKPLFNNKKNANRMSGAVRKPIKEPPQQTADKRESRRSTQKPLLLIGGGVLILAGVSGWLFTSSKEQQPIANIPWKSCLTKWQDGTLYPDLLPVPTGKYQLSSKAQELKPFLVPHGLKKVTIDTPFLIEKHEVTIKAFRQYVNFIDQLDSSAEKERLQARIGLQWNKSDIETSSVKGVSWEGAWDFADWLGQQTGCAYSLPSREQWGAAVILLNDSHDNSNKARILTDASLKSLLWGVREWSASPCTGGYYLLGEDDLVPLPEIRSATCMPAMLSVAGFRVAIKAATSTPSSKNTQQLPAKAKP